MSTPSIQTLITQAQQVLNLKSSNEIRATLAAVLANANVGTPLNPNLTTQQLWDEFYEIVRQPSDDIMSIITDQMMRMVFSPPAPGGAGADKQVIFNDGGVLAGDAGLVYNKTTDALTVAGLVTAGSATITGAATVGTTLGVTGNLTASQNVYVPASTTYKVGPVGSTWGGLRFDSTNQAFLDSDIGLTFRTGGATSFTTSYQIGATGISTWSVAGTTAMTLNATGLGIGNVPVSGQRLTVEGGDIYLKSANKLTLDNASNNFGAQIYNIGASAQAALAFKLGATQAMTLDASGNLLVGKTAIGTTVGIEVRPDGYLVVTRSATTDATGFTNAVYSSGASAYRFYVGMGGTVYATNTTISSLSDARLKENIQDIDVGLAAILSLKPRKFDWKDGRGKGIKGDRGFIAQEFETVFPNLVDEWKDPAPEGEAPYKSVRQDLIPVLVKAIQELTARVQTLEAK